MAILTGEYNGKQTEADVEADHDEEGENQVSGQIPARVLGQRHRLGTRFQPGAHAVHTHVRRLRRGPGPSTPTRGRGTMMG